jgi:hypothetical protein
VKISRLSFVFQVTALWLASGQIPATTLGVLINEHQVGFDGLIKTLWA